MYQIYSGPRWTPDGTAVVYLRGLGSRLVTLVRVALDGTQRRLADVPNSTRFDVSPTDGRLALTYNRFPEERNPGSNLMVTDRDGGNARVIRPTTGVYYSQPAWTADGRSVLARRQNEPNSATSQLYLVNVDTGEDRILGTVPAGSTYTLSPDGTWMVLAAGDTDRLLLVNLANLADQRPIGVGRAPAWEPAAPTRVFPETGKSLGGGFLTYWQTHGGLAINGYPISAEFTERLEDGKEYTVQYCERVRLEYHPENPPPHNVLLGQFGRRIHPADPPVPAEAGYTYFPETGHNVGPRFTAYWGANGGLAQFGYPISELIEERLEDGNVYLVHTSSARASSTTPRIRPPTTCSWGSSGGRSSPSSRPSASSLSERT